MSRDDRLAELREFVLECEARVAATLLEAMAAGVDPVEIAAIADRWRSDLAEGIDTALDEINQTDPATNACRRAGDDD